jgi:hypothetical protein
MRANAKTWAVALLSAIAPLAGCSHTLPQDWKFKSSDATSLAVFDWPYRTADAPFAFSSFSLIEVDLERQVLGTRSYVIGGLDTPRQLAADFTIDDGSLLDAEREWKTSLFVPYQMAPGDYAIVGGFDRSQMYTTTQVMLRSAPVLRIRPDTISVVDTRLLMRTAGFKFFYPDSDGQRALRRAKIALHGYPEIVGKIELADFLAVVEFPLQSEKPDPASKAFTILSLQGTVSPPAQ